MKRMEFLLTFVTLSVAMFGFLPVICNGQKLQLQIKTINRCSDPKYSGLDVGFEKLVYSMQPNTQNIMVNGLLIVRKDLNNIYFEIEVNRCISEDVHSCQKFVVLNYTQLCEELGTKDVIWTTLVDNIKGIPGKCPIKAGSYEIDQAYVDLEKTQETLNLPAGHWLANVRFYEKRTLLTCYYVIAVVKPERKRKSSSKLF